MGFFGSQGDFLAQCLLEVVREGRQSRGTVAHERRSVHQRDRTGLERCEAPQRRSGERGVSVAVHLLEPAAGDAGVVSWGSLAVWTSSDGLSWQRLADISVDGPIEVLSVVSDGKHAIVSILNKAGSTALLVGNGLQ